MATISDCCCCKNAFNVYFLLILLIYFFLDAIIMLGSTQSIRTLILIYPESPCVSTFKSSIIFAEDKTKCDGLAVMETDVEWRWQKEWMSFKEITVGHIRGVQQCFSAHPADNCSLITVLIWTQCPVKSCNLIGYSINSKLIWKNLKTNSI